MKKQYNIAWYAIVVIVALLVTRYTLNIFVTHPGAMLHNLGGDAIKNFFTYTYYSLHGDGLWFTGMNYPYGEHLVYTDGFPLLSVPLSWLRAYVSLTLADVTAVLNITLATSFFLGIVYVYKLLVEFKVHKAFALVTACLIVVMSPQVTRMFGHYGLGLICVFPMTFYWLLKYHRSDKKQYLAYIIALYILTPFAHPYYIAIIAVWMLLYTVGSLLLHRRKIKRAVLPLLVPLLSAIVFKTVMSTTDPVTDRPETPYGTLSACTTGTDIFTSDKSPVWMQLQESHLLDNIGTASAEGAAYMGIIPIIIMLIVIIGIVVNRFSGKTGKSEPFERIWLFIGFFSLLAGMGVPFVWKMNWLLDYLEAFKQFRSLGRFSLIFYYTTSILAVVVLYRLIQNLLQKRRQVGIAFMILSIAVWSYEAYSFSKTYYYASKHGTYNYNFYTSKDEPSWNDFFKEEHLSTSEFQAIAIVPFTSIGSEKIWLFANPWSGFCMVTRAIDQLKIPMMSSNMSRSSWGQTFKHIKTFNGPFGDKPVFDDLNSEKDILLLCVDDYKLDPDEQFLLDQAEWIGHFHIYNVYRLNPKRLKKAVQQNKQYVLSIADSLINGDTSLLNSRDVYHNHFDEGVAAETLFSSAAKRPLDTKTGNIVNIDVENWQQEELYELSVWTLGNNLDYRLPVYDLFCYNDKNEQLMYDEVVCARRTFDVHDFWFRTNSFFTLPKGTKTIGLGIRDGDEGVYFAIDELLIRQARDTIISKDIHGNIMVNNHLLRSTN